MPKPPKPVPGITEDSAVVPLPDSVLDGVAGGAGTLSPAQLDQLLRTGATPDGGPPGFIPPGPFP